MITLRRFFCLVVVFLCITVYIHPLNAEKTDSLRGNPFTDPSQIFDMPSDWIEKPITYEDWAKGSDLVVILDQGEYQIIIPLIEKFAKEHGLKIAVKEGTCGISAGMLGRKAVDIAGFCCPPGREDRLPGLKFHTLGIVAKAFLLHPDNPVESVTVRELTEVFRGKIQKWSELKTPKGLPGPAWTIRTIGRFHCPTRPGHWRLLLNSDKLFSPRVQEVGSIPDMIAQVAAYKGAIGWEVPDMIEIYKSLGRVKMLKINGYAPTDRDALATKKYPFYRTYNITTWEGKGLENPHVGKLLEYLAKEVEGIDPKSGFVPSSMLRKAGWKFKDNELVGEPERR